MRTVHVKTNLILHAIAVAALLALSLLVRGAATVSSMNTPTTMQQMTKDHCASMTVYDGTNPGVILTLNDPRNNQSYQVAKLADDNCWMLNNLKITPQDVASAAAGLNNPGVNNAVLATAASDAPSEDTPKWYSPIGSADITDPTFYGYLYNWCAATGATASTCTLSPVQPTDAITDICPANWSLPKGGEEDDANNEFSQLNAKMAGFTDNQDATYLNDTTIYQDNWWHDGPVQGVFSGGLFGFPIDDFAFQGTDALLWSSSSYPSHQYLQYLAHYVTFSKSDIQINDYNGLRDYGMAVRCVTTGGAAQPVDPGTPGSPATGFGLVPRRSY